MTKTASVNKIDRTFLIGLDPDGKLNLAACLQCGRCSSGCTMREETDILPHQLNRMAAFGLKDELLKSKHIWMCVSCQTCVSRCPMGVNTPALIDKLREMAESAPGDLENVRVFNETMLKSIRRFGRTWEFGMMAGYKIRTRDFFSDLDKFPKMLMKGKMKLLPPITRNRKAVQMIFDKVRQRRREQ